jgi:hypothetical protein
MLGRFWPAAAGSRSDEPGSGACGRVGRVTGWRRLISVWRRLGFPSHRTGAPASYRVLLVAGERDGDTYGRVAAYRGAAPRPITVRSAV